MKTASVRRIETIGAHLDAGSSSLDAAHNPPKSHSNVILIDGESLTPERLRELASNPSSKIDLTSEAWNKVREGRRVVDQIVRSQKVTYGINTGFGNFANTVIPADKLSELQVNLIRSHAVGVGEPLKPYLARMLCLLRINALAKGFSGISAETLKGLILLFNLNLMSRIPSQGTVGASGDLCPLAHLALGLIGEGQIWNPKTEKYEDAASVLQEYNVKPVALQPKEGLALINGTQFISAIGSEAVVRAKECARVADLVAAFSVEVLQGTWKAYLPQIHAVRPHKGQISTARRVLRLLRGWKSEVSEAHADCGKVQDAYTLRCVPQIHGVCRDTIKFVHGLLRVEINSATDNPMVFAEDNSILSGGNFHAEYPAKACDFLAIAVHELANVSERRIERLCNPSLNGHLPPFLVRAGGLNSGMMMAHVTAASLVSENKGLCHPASVDSISTSAGQEDHVSMGGWAARKALRVVENVEFVLAIELMCVCQALDFLRPLTSTKPIEAVYAVIRSVCPTLDKDRYMSPDIAAIADLVRTGKIWGAAKEAILE